LVIEILSFDLNFLKKKERKEIILPKKVSQLSPKYPLGQAHTPPTTIPSPQYGPVPIYVNVEFLFI